MTAAVGRTLILLALLVSTSGALVGLALGSRPTAALVGAMRRIAYAFALLMLAANGLMVYALLARDFSVGYVAQVGSRDVPSWVAAVSLWSSLEGSILFWGLVLGLFIGVATLLERGRYPEHLPYASAIWLACGAFFSFLLAGPAQPFATVLNPVEGRGPNPLLQNHILMAIHPPMLYLGFVGMTIPFGLASAALLRGQLGPDLLRPLRVWLLVPWTFLSAAIVLGGWWAYEVLGWGGYWAWDPVENASLLPWLTATAAVHSLLLTERKGLLKGWSATLILATFLLTILGTFMTRSGVFNSVHSFTQSPIGPTILVFLSAAFLFSLGLLAARVDTLKASGKLESLRSREGSFLVNNLLLVLVTFTVLIGTTFPLIVEATRRVQMSVGRPYFDSMIVPLGVALLFLLGVGPALPWERAEAVQLRRALLPPLVGVVPALLLAALLRARTFWLWITFALAGYALTVVARELWTPWRRRALAQGSWGTALVDTHWRNGRRRLGAQVVHAGIVLIIVAIAVSNSLGTTQEVQLSRGVAAHVGSYALTFQGVETRAEAHRQSTLARVRVSRAGRDLGVLVPRMNQYAAQREPIGTPAVRWSLSEDLYLSFISLDASAETLALSVFVNPLVSWIWLATGIVLLGSLLALWPARGRARAEGERA
jgi:cytochrome c-type biogenesis protein CcmF